MRVLVAGCGYVGTALARRLRESGHEVVATRRDADALPADLDVDRRSLDLTDRAAVTALPDVDAVAITVSADARDVEAYRTAYVDTTQALLDGLGARDRPPSRWLFTSSTAVYGDTGGDWVDEDTPTDPASDTGVVLVEAESRLLDTPVDAVVVRLGGIYGPTRTRLLDSVLRGRASCPPTTTWTNRIHRDDAAAICHELLVRDDVPAIVNGVDDDPAERCEVLTWIADQLGVDRPGVDDDARRRSNKRVRNRRLHELDIELVHPSFRDGYARMIQDRQDLS